MTNVTYVMMIILNSLHPSFSFAINHLSTDRPKLKHNCIVSNSSTSSLNVNCYSSQSSSGHNQLGPNARTKEHNLDAVLADVADVLVDGTNDDLGSRQQLNDLIIMNGHQPSKAATNYNGRHHSNNRMTTVYRYVYPLTWFVCEVYELSDTNNNTNNDVDTLETGNKEENKLNLVYNLSISSAQNLALVKSLISPTMIQQDQMKFTAALMAPSVAGMMSMFDQQHLSDGTHLVRERASVEANNYGLSGGGGELLRHNLIDNSDFMFIVPNLTSATAFKLKIYAQNSFDRSNQYIWMNGRTLEPQYLRHSTSGARINYYDQTKTTLNGEDGSAQSNNNNNNNGLMNKQDFGQVTIGRSNGLNGDDDVVTTINQQQFSGDRSNHNSAIIVNSYTGQNSDDTKMKYYWNVSLTYVKQQPILIIIASLSAFMIVIIALVGSSVACMRTRRHQQRLAERTSRQQQQQHQHHQHQQQHDGSDTAGSECNELVGKTKLIGANNISNCGSLPRIINTHHSGSIEFSNSSQMSSGSSSASAALLGINSTTLQVQSKQQMQFNAVADHHRRASHDHDHDPASMLTSCDLDKEILAMPLTNLDMTAAQLRSAAYGHLGPTDVTTQSKSLANKVSCFQLDDGHYHNDATGKQQYFDGHQIVDAYDLAVRMHELDHHHHHHLHHHQQQQQQQLQHHHHHHQFKPYANVNGMVPILSSSKFNESYANDDQAVRLKASDLISTDNQRQYCQYLNCGTLPNIRHLGQQQTDKSTTIKHAYQNRTKDNVETICGSDGLVVRPENQQQQLMKQANCSESIYSASSMSGSSPLPISHATSTTGGCNSSSINNRLASHHLTNHHGHYHQHGQALTFIEANNGNNLSETDSLTILQPHHCHLSLMIDQNQFGHHSTPFGGAVCSDINTNEHVVDLNYNNNDPQQQQLQHNTNIIDDTTNYDNDNLSPFSSTKGLSCLDNVSNIGGGGGGGMSQQHSIYGHLKSPQQAMVESQGHINHGKVIGRQQLLQQSQPATDDAIYQSMRLKRKHKVPSESSPSNNYSPSQQHIYNLTITADINDANTNNNKKNNAISNSAHQMTNHLGPKEGASSSQTSADTDSSLMCVIPTTGGPTSADSGISGNHSVSSSNGSQISTISHRQSHDGPTITTTIGSKMGERRMSNGRRPLANNSNNLGANIGGHHESIVMNSDNIKQVHFELDERSNLRIRNNNNTTNSALMSNNDNKQQQQSSCLANNSSSLEVSPIKTIVTDHQSAGTDQCNTDHTTNDNGFNVTDSTSSPSSNLSDMTIGGINAMII